MTIIELHEETQQLIYCKLDSNVVSQYKLNDSGWTKVGLCKSESEAAIFITFFTMQFMNRGIKLTSKDAIETFNNLGYFAWNCYEAIHKNL
jgi:hypothetical protein